MSDPSGGQETIAIRTFLIADIRGWTAFTAENGDEAASQLAAKFADVASEGVEAWNGRVVELRGDEALAVFASGRDALRAAAELQAAFAAETRMDSQLPLTVGIGLEAGEAVPVRGGYRGAALNVAARLCSLAVAGETMATANLAQLAGPLPDLDYESLPPASLKGLKQPVVPVRITRSASATDDEIAPLARTKQPTHPPLPPELEPIIPLAGRQSELRWLAWHWRRAGHGAGRCIVLSGPPGIGKTRLAAELATIAQVSGATIIYRPSTATTDELTSALDEAGQTLVIVDDLDAAPPDLSAAVTEIGGRLNGRPVLLLVTHRQEAARRLRAIVERLAPPQQQRRLGPLEPDAVRQIAALYAGRAAHGIPVSDIIESSGGVPAAVHRWSSAWARSAASQRLETSANRTSTGRRRLRKAHEELVGDVADLELVRERSELYGASAESAMRRDICPYKGLAAFEAADSEYYFGRERLVAELIARLVGTSFLGLIGASGSGKSSALRAGLLPALAGGVLPGSDGWRPAVMRPGEHPLSELERLLGGDLDAALGGLGDDARLVLVVDQFEEVFNATRDEDERAGFIDLLTTERRALKVVIAMRADHYGHCAAYPSLARLIGTNQVLVGPLTSPELAAVIEHPAQRVGLRVEPDLTAALLADLGTEPGALPLLSTALLELWQARDQGRLTLAAYRASGGVHGAVARLADRAYAALAEDEQQIARGIFLRLAGTGEAEGVVRRRVPLAEFDLERDTATSRVLQELTDARLLTSGEGSIEVAHEALLREWPLLRQWLDEDAAGRQLRLHLIDAAHDWETRGREPGDLYRGARLTAALDWSADRVTELNELERQFIEESRRASEREADRQRRTNRRLRLFLAGAGVFLLVAIGAGAFAAYQGGLASDAEQFARSRELAASAIAARDEDPALSKLLAVAAASIADPPVESVAALHRAWDADRIIYRYAWPADVEVGFVNGDLDPSGRYIAASGDIFSEPHDYVEVVDREQDGKKLWSFRSAEGLAVGVATFTPDGSRVVFGAFFDREPGTSTCGTGPPTCRGPHGEAGIYVRDARSGAEIQRIDTGACGAAVLAVSNRTAIALTSNSFPCLGPSELSVRPISLESIDLATGERTTLAALALPNNEDAVSADGLTIAFNEIVLDPDTGEASGAPAVVMRPATGQRVELPVREFAQVHDVSADGSRILVDVDGKLQVWGLNVEDLADLGDEQLISEFAPDPSTHGAFAQFAPNGASVFSTGNDGRLHLWDVESGEERLAYRAPEGRPSPNAAGLVLVPSSEGPTALLIDTSLRAEIATVDNSAIASKTVPSGGCTRAREGQAVTTVGQIVAATNMCSEDGVPEAETFTLLDRTSLKPVGSVNGGFVGVLSPDGTRLARRKQRLDGEELFVGPVEVVDVATGTRLFQLEGLCWFNRSDPSQLEGARLQQENDGCNPFPLTPFAMDVAHEYEIRWSPDGTMIAMLDDIGGYFGVWDATDGTFFPAEGLAVYDQSRRPFNVAFTADSEHLVVSYTASSSYTAERNTGTPLNGLATISTTDWREEATRSLPDRARDVLLIGSSADGSSMVGVGGFLREAGGTQGDKALYWIDPISLADARPSTLRIHAARIQAAALSADGTLVATGASDGSIRIWDGSGRLVSEMEFPGMGVIGLAFISQTHLGVVLEDGNLRVDTIDTDELLDIARASLTRGFSEDECDRYHFDPCPTLEEMRNGSLPH